ncbi:MAG: Smr/MutS family protein [Desulfovibrio sp.]|jgi:DNA mismatch repair protein MutS2|nr:Smr/MutS family protein [Desulfovibrio sp.]
MDTRTLHALELQRVLAYLAGFAVSEAGFRTCLELRPLRRQDFPGEADGTAAFLAVLRREAELFEQGRLLVERNGCVPTPFVAVDGLLEAAAAPNYIPDADDLFALRGLLLQGKEKVAAVLACPPATEPGWPLWVARCPAGSMPVKTLSGLSRCFSDDGLIRDEASPGLAAVRGELRALHRRCVNKVKDYVAEYNITHFLQDDFMTLSSDRYVLPLKSNFKGRLQGVIHDYSRTGETCRFEPLFLVEVNNRLQRLKQEEREEERKILRMLGGLLKDELAGIGAVYRFLRELDLLCARLALAECYDGRTADFAEDRGFLLRSARHPLLLLERSPAAREALRRTEQRLLDAGRAPEAHEERDREAAPGGPPTVVVPADIELPPERRALIISGGNAGGKTVCLKSAGLIALMSLCSLPVPVAAGSVMPPWRNIRAFIGDAQSLEEHVSTFTAQIERLARIWPELSDADLILLDEFGAGTDPAQGAALAQALVDALTESGARVMAATHFPELKAYALTAPGARAASMLFAPKTDKPLFRLVYDQVGASRALDVARAHGLPEAVLRRAEQYMLPGCDGASAALIERLNDLAAAKAGEVEALGRERAELAERKRQVREEAEAERLRLSEYLRAEARKVLDEWKTGRAGHKQTLRELARLRKAVSAGGERSAGPAERAPVDLAALEPRARVRHVPWKRLGTVLEIDERKKRLRLDFDGVSLWAEAADIELADGGGTFPNTDGGARLRQNSPARTGQSPNVFFPAPYAPVSLDIRGERADTALGGLTRFLDRAVTDGRAEVEIIHGRGTGVLRREVHAFLRTFQAVRSFRLAPEDRGGDGMTIVEL